MSDLLDRPLGDLTLRELTRIGKLAQAVTAALEASEPAGVAREPSSLPTVADGIRAVVAGKSLPVGSSSAQGNGADGLASAIAARTAPSNGRPPRPPRTREEVDKVLDETRAEVEAVITTDVLGVEHRRGAPGKGRKACPKCHEVTGGATKECVCGYRFIPKNRFTT